MNEQMRSTELFGRIGSFENEMWFKAHEIQSLYCGINRVSDDALNGSGDAEEALEHVLNLTKIGMDLAGRLKDGLEDGCAEILAAREAAAPTEERTEQSESGSTDNDRRARA